MRPERAPTERRRAELTDLRIAVTSLRDQLDLGVGD